MYQFTVITTQLILLTTLELLYLFLRAAITRYHELSGLKQQKCILSQLWKRDSEIKVSVGPRDLCRLQGRVLPCLF